jgi:hypothetical protein
MSTAKVVRERFTYERNTSSFFADVIAADQGNADAAQRLWRHAQEMTALRKDTGVTASERALSSTDTAGGYLVPPLYLQEEFVNLSRAGRVTANVIGSRALPGGVSPVGTPPNFSEGGLDEWAQTARLHELAVGVLGRRAGGRGRQTRWDRPSGQWPLRADHDHRPRSADGYEPGDG